MVNQEWIYMKLSISTLKMNLSSKSLSLLLLRLKKCCLSLHLNWMGWTKTLTDIVIVIIIVIEIDTISIHVIFSQKNYECWWKKKRPKINVGCSFEISIKIVHFIHTKWLIAPIWMTVNHPIWGESWIHWRY